MTVPACRRYFTASSENRVGVYASMSMWMTDKGASPVSFRYLGNVFRIQPGTSVTFSATTGSLPP